MDLLSTISLMVFMVYVFLGVYVYRLNPKSPVNKIFLFLSLSFAVWAFTFAFFYSAADKQTAWFWYNLSSLGRFLYPAILLNISLIFTKNRFFTEKWYNSLPLYIPVFIFLYAIITGPFITQDLVQVNAQWYEILITSTGWWFAYNSYYLLYDIAAIIIFLWWGYKSTLLREKKQALIIIVTGTLALTLGILTNTIFQALNIYLLPSIAQIFGLIFFMGIGYAIIEYQLLKVTFTVAAEQIITKITDIVILMNAEGKIINTNPQAENLLGYTEYELKGKTWKFLMPDDQDIEKIRNKLENLKKSYNNGQYNNQLLKSIEITLKTKENEKIPVKSFLSLIKDKYGIIGVLLVGQDLRQTRKLQYEIEEKIKAQKSARNHAERLEIINHIIISAHKTDDLPSLLEKILNSTLELSGFSSGGIYLLEENRQSAELMHGENLSPEYANQFQIIDASKDPFKKVITESKFTAGSYHELFSNNHGEWDFISAAIIPLIVQNQVMGFIILLSWDQKEFSVSQVEILESLGREVGAAISRIKTEDKIKRSLKEKEILLKEIHHRVKNNMQIISSMLSLQSSYLKDKDAIHALKECQGRIMSMAMIHENLYQSDTLTGIKFADYINRLTKDLFHTYNIDSERIKINIDADEIILDIDTAIPCGLIINEVVTNSIKHAFPDDAEGEIYIQMQQNPEGYNLSLKDNGIGLPENLNINNTTTLGLLLVNSLVRQLEGILEVKRNQGTIFLISFKKLEYSQRI